MNRKVKYLRLHEAVHIVGVGDLGPVLPPTNKVVPGLAMVSHESGVFLYTAKEEAFIPWPNIKIAVFQAEAKVQKVPDAA